MNMTHPRMSKIIYTEINCSGPSRPPSISVSVLNLQLNCIETETSKH